MPLTAQNLVKRACQIANVPGMTVQAGQYLNEILTELTQDYDLAIALNTTTIVLDGNTPNNGVGPYTLPTNYLRMASRDFTYVINGVPYTVTQITLSQFDTLVNVITSASYPQNFVSDVSTSPPSLFVYPPPLIVINAQLRYYGTMPEIVTPESSAVVPWFPCESYLKIRLSGELMRDAGDARAGIYLGDSPAGAVGILRRWLNLQGDREDVISSVQLDARYFGGGSSNFPPSKVTGGV